MIDKVWTLYKIQKEKCPRIGIYSKLNESHISDEAYEHAQKVWSEFDCETMRDYHDLYLKSDVLLLADVFENFRDVCLTKYELDPAWYYTAPGLAWDAALKKTKVELELLSDPDMLDSWLKRVSEVEFPASCIGTLRPIISTWVKTMTQQNLASTFST